MDLINQLYAYAIMLFIALMGLCVIAILVYAYGLIFFTILASIYELLKSIKRWL